MESDNFVKRNLKRKNGKFNYKKPNPRRGISSRKAREETTNEEGPEVTAASQSKKHGCVMDWGLDPLSITMDWMKQNSVPNGKNPVPPKRSDFAPSSKAVRGITSSKNPENNHESCFYNSRTLSPEELDILSQYAPKCNGHQMIARLFTVNKSGNNKGRRFYSCTYPYDQRCSFFMWAENNPRLLDAELLTNKQLTTDAVGFAVRVYQRKLHTLNKDQLVQELKTYNRRRSELLVMGKDALDNSIVWRDLQDKKRLAVSGSKQDILQTLLTEAHWWFLRYQQCFLSYCHTINHGTITTATGQWMEEKEEEEEEEEEELIFLSDSEDDNDDVVVDTEEEQEDEELDEEEDDSTINIISNHCNKVIKVEDVLTAWCFGYSSLRFGQRWTIERLLHGQNTLTIMPTGSGKSLCYMLTALLSPGLTIVVSPLIALMNDQLAKLPIELPGICLTNQFTTMQYLELCHAILHQQIKILFVSPERLCSIAFRKFLQTIHATSTAATSANPIVSLLCVDEAHCLSQWSFNFRPAFLRIRRELKYIQPKAILALTATANEQVQADICCHLQIPVGAATATDGGEGEGGVCRITDIRENLWLSAKECDHDEGKRQMVLQTLLSSSSSSTSSDCANKPKAKQSTKTMLMPLSIVYVWRRMDAETVGDYLHAGNVSNTVYHGGLESNERESIQKQFDRGNTRCIVATIAFGMGVDKADVRQVIHFALPKSVEHYLQEIGRAGRDQQIAKCVLCFTKEDAISQYAFAQSHRVSRLQLIALLFLILPYELLQTANKVVAMSVTIQTMEQTLDLSEVQLETILSLLELMPFQFLEVDRIHYERIQGKFRIPKESMASATATSAAHPFLQTMIVMQQEKSKLQKLQKQQQQQQTEPKEQPTKRWKPSNDQEEGGSLFPEYETTTATVPRTSVAGQEYSQEFDLSRSALAERMHMDIEEVTKALYQLQSSGKIEYSLSEQAIRFKYNPTVLTKIMKSSYWSTFDAYQQWIVSIANDLYTVLDTFQNEASYNVIKMWKLASLLAQLTKQTSEGEEKEQEQRLISQVIQTTALQIMNDRFDLQKLQTNHNNANNATVETEPSLPPTIVLDSTVPLALLTTQCMQWYHHLPSPCQTFHYHHSSSSSGNEKELKEMVSLLSKAPMLLSLVDKMTKQVLNYVLKKSPSPSSSSSSSCNNASMQQQFKQIIVQARREAIAKYICSILFGIGSAALSPSLWSTGMYRDYWASYRAYDYHDLYSRIQSILLVK